MSNKTEKKEIVKSLEMIPLPAGTLNAESSLTGELITTEPLPELEKLERLNLPPMLNLKEVPVKSTISGVIIKLVENFTGREDMRKARLLHLKHASGTEFLLPLSGVIKNALKPFIVEDTKDKESYTLKPEIIGRTLYVTRQHDGTSKKFGGKTMFMFDVLLSKADNSVKSK